MEMNRDYDGGRLSTSKGNQAKTKVGDYWYKIDFLGYEGLSEYLTSELLAHTNIKDYAQYDMVEVPVSRRTFLGCRSKDFLNADEEIMTASRIFKTYTGLTVEEFLQPQSGLSNQISSFVNKVQEITGIKNYGQELTRVLEWDGFILNDDRHFNNIAFIYNSVTKSFSSCTLFDNGAAFLSDTRYDYPLEKNVYGLIADVKAKPFSESFDKQISACEELYGVQLKVDRNICITTEMEERIRNYYGDAIYERVSNIFEHQKALCDYLCDMSAEQMSCSKESHIFDND